MATVMAGPEHRYRGMSPGQYLGYLNRTAIYAATRGVPFLLVIHVAFLVTFIEAMVDEGNDSASHAAHVLFDRWPEWSQDLIAKWLGSSKISNRALLLVLLAPLVLPLVLVVPYDTLRSVLASSWDVLRKGVRGVPPLITAVVVVFVTGDAWRILGTGFTVRFTVLVVVFLLGSLLFLIRWNCWDDLDAQSKEAKVLLAGIKHKRPVGFNEFVRRGIEPAPMIRPRGFGALYVGAGYVALSAFALMVAALFVSSALIIVGVILISKAGTMTLANAVYVYQTWPGGVVFTKQLLSLSFSLGAFAAFFLVAAQRPADRREFMRNVLVRYRRVLLVSSIYCRAHDQAAAWTGVQVDIKPLCDPPAGQGGPGGSTTARSA
jgi:hypothetical protein